MSNPLRIALFLMLAAGGPLACGEDPADGEPETGEPELPPEIPADPNAVDLAGAADLFAAHCADGAQGMPGPARSADADALFIYQVSVAQNGGTLIRNDPDSADYSDNFVHVAVANLGDVTNASDWGVQVVGGGLPPMLYNPMVDEVVDGDPVDMWAEAWLSDIEFLPDDRVVTPCGFKVLRVELRLDPETPAGNTPVDVALVTGDGSIHHVVRTALPVRD